MLTLKRGKKLLASFLTMTVVVAAAAFPVMADEYNKISPNDTVHIECDGGEQQIFTFTPDESGFYAFYSYDSEAGDPFVAICDLDCGEKCC